MLFLSLFSELLIIIFGTYILTGQDLTKKQLLAMIGIGGISIYILFSLVDQLVFPLLALCCSLYLYRVRSSRWEALLPVTALIIAVISDLLTFIILLWLYDVSILTLNSETPFYSVIYTFGTFIFTSLICLILAKLLQKRQVSRSISIEHLWLFALALLSILGSLFFNIRVLHTIEVELGMTTDLLLVILLYLLTLLVVAHIAIRITKEKNQMVSEREQAKQLNEYTEKLEEQYQAIRKNRHDYMNILMSMTNFVEDNDTQGLQEYIETKVLPAEKQVKIYEEQLDHLINLKISPVKGLVSSKLILAQVKDAQVTVEIPEPVYEWNIDDFDMVRILGVLLDNAYEESEYCVNPEINIAIFPQGLDWQVIVANNCRLGTEHPIKLKKEGFSTKGDDRGLGLSILDEIVSKNNQLSLETTVCQGKFTQKLTILNK